MNNSKFNEEEANKRYDEKYGNKVNPDRNPLFDPDGDDFTDALFQDAKTGIPGPETSLLDRMEDVSMPVAVNDTVTELTGANTIDELVDKMLLISGEDNAEEKLRNITRLLTPDEQKHVFHLLDITFGYDYDEESMNVAIMARTFQLDKIHEGEGAIKFNLTDLEKEANEIYPDTLSQPVELCFFDLDSDVYDALVEYRKDPQNAPKPVIPEKFLLEVPKTIDGHSIDREQLILTGKFQPKGSDVYYHIGSQEEEFELLQHTTIDRISPDKPVRKIRLDQVSFPDKPKEPKMIPSEIKFQDGSAIQLSKKQGIDITKGKKVKVMHKGNGVLVSISYNPDSDKGVTVKVSEPRKKEDNVIKINKPKLRL